jgi:hypothetical protein
LGHLADDNLSKTCLIDAVVDVEEKEGSSISLTDQVERLQPCLLSQPQLTRGGSAESAGGRYRLP